MSDRSLFTAAAAAETNDGQWEIVGEITPHDVANGTPRKVALSKDRLQFVVLIQIGLQWTIQAGPWSYETMLRCAENVVAGDPRAITWPDAQLCLSVGYLALWCEMEKRRAARAATPEETASQ